jgi:chloride channel 7
MDQYPDQLRTVQIIGNIAAVSSSLHVGKAGPMVHTGACIAAIFGQGGSRKYGLTCRWLRYFKNDRDRRDLVTIGAGAGVTVAFRAPVGGVLFALESLCSWCAKESHFFSTHRISTTSCEE